MQMMVLLQCRSLVRYARRKLVGCCKRQTYLIVAMAAVMMLWIAAEYVSLRNEQHGRPYVMCFCACVGTRSSAVAEGPRAML